ncbi:uncharacterized protein AKAME5_001173500 [Lates japonicus]|uniref:SAM domain-containing protein n=1 Tax=Lates japonicus TaxID=270547 RepID=A0AAD3MRK0_LATJO|nr:uncharacterized protein AKAME5_001173500 [Lates japonicus]
MLKRQYLPHALGFNDVVPPSAETPMPDDFLCDPPVDSKRYAVDPSDSAFNVMTSQYPTKHSYSYRGSSCSTPMGMCRQASSPGSFQDGNRNGYSPMPDSGECKRPAAKDPSSWGVEEVVWFIKDADPQALGPHADAFRKHEIDGDALLLLKSEMMMKYLGLKLGPALKLCYHIDRLKQNRGEHGRRFGEDTTSRRRGFFRRRLLGGLAGQQNEEKVPGLEEETTARQTVRNAEEAGPGLNGLGLSCVLHWLTCVLHYTCIYLPHLLNHDWT